jgi:hypothetical protein
MNEAKREAVVRVPTALDLIVLKTAEFKVYIEGVHRMALDKQLPSMETALSDEGTVALLAGLLAALHIVQQLDILVVEIETLGDTVLELLSDTQPSITSH